MSAASLLNAISFAGYLVTRPHLLVPLLRGLYLPVYVQYEWLRQYEFRTGIDVGASRGNVTRALLHLFPNSTVYAFEPLPAEFERLVRRARSPRLIATRTALGNKIGSDLLFATRYAPASSLLKVSELGAVEMPGARGADVIEVPCTTLDDFFGNLELAKPIFLKIDVQGAERLVLEGGTNLIKQVSVIHVETSFKELYENQVLFGELYEFLVTRGFSYRGSTREAQFYPLFGIESQENSIFTRD